MNAISNYEFYNKEMSKGLEDKLFFMDKIVFSHLLDYGCANGMLIESMAEFFPYKKYIGYDFDEKMIKLSKDKHISNAKFFSDLKHANLNMSPDKSMNAVLCSSLIHEVYSYGTNESIEQFWRNLYSGEYHHIIIRDMTLCNDELNGHKKTDSADLKKVYKKANAWQIEQFESIWGSLSVKKNFIHFLMKYRYLENWSREVAENYFPISIEEHINKIPPNYEVIHFEHFLLPFQKEVINKDFGIDLNVNTHIKIITKKIPQ